jgi:hypothetical protein
MKKINLTEIPFTEKVGDMPTVHEPNVKEDCFLVHDSEIIGFYLRKMPDIMRRLLSIANNEFISDRVPKMDNVRMSGVSQYSSILGGIPPKYAKDYANISMVHRSKTAQKFIKAMFALNIEAEKLLKKLVPNIYDRQKKLVAERIKPEWRIGDLYTSSINNANISADYHRDTANIRNTVNVIMVKKKSATGGNLHVPKYGATVDCCNDSMLVYPAWRDMHGVTPIDAKGDGYRNSFVFYPLEKIKHA